MREGKIIRASKVRLIRDGIVIYTGDLGSLKRFKDDVKEVNTGFECGLNIDKFNDIKVGDIEQIEVKRKLEREGFARYKAVVANRSGSLPLLYAGAWNERGGGVAPVQVELRPASWCHIFFVKNCSKGLWCQKKALSLSP